MSPVIDLEGRSERRPTLPASTVRQILGAIWAALLEMDAPILPDDNFFDLGADSMKAVEMLIEVERVFRVNIPATFVMGGGTLSEMSSILADDYVLPTFEGLVRVHGAGDKTPFFLVHDWFGGAVHRTTFWSEFPADRVIYEIQAQGVDGGAPLLESIPEMASRYVRLMRQVQAQGPYLVGGFSVGGTIAFEMARHLQSSGEAVLLLVMVDTELHDPLWLRLITYSQKLLSTPVRLWVPKASAKVRSRLRIAGLQLRTRITDKRSRRPIVPQKYARSFRGCNTKLSTPGV